MDKHGGKYPFCPGKATWHPVIKKTFDECLLARQSGVLPKVGRIDDQSELFAICFPVFLERYQWRWYGRVWQDVGEVIPKVLEAIAKMLGAKK